MTRIMLRRLIDRRVLEHRERKTGYPCWLVAHDSMSYALVDQIRETVKQPVDRVVLTPDPMRDNG